MNRYATLDRDVDGSSTWYSFRAREPRFLRSVQQLGLPATDADDVPDLTPSLQPRKVYAGLGAPRNDVGAAQRAVVDLFCRLVGKSCPATQRGDTVPGVGTVVASGVRGTTIGLPPFGNERRVFDMCRTRGTNVVVGAKRAYRSERFLVKVQFCANRREETDAVREDEIHRHIADSSVVVRGETVDGASIVPEFLIGATLAVAGRVVRVTLMAMVQAVSSAARLSPMPVDVYVRIERALLALWSFGISHSDLHFENILIDELGRPIIIDLGYAVQLPSRLKQNMVDAIERLPVKDDVWPLYNEYYFAYASLVMLRRGFDAGNPDTASLRQQLATYPLRAVRAARAALYARKRTWLSYLFG